MDQPQGSVDYLRLVRRVLTGRRRLVLAVFLVIALPSIAWTLLATENTYEASATLFLLPDKSEPVFLREFAAPEVNVLYQVILKSRSLAQGVVETLPKESRVELCRRLGLRVYILAGMQH